MPMDDMAGFMARVLVREGAWVIEPERRDGGFVERVLQTIRTVPARIYQPTGRNPYRFAERGQYGRWFFIWVPDNELCSASFRKHTSRRRIPDR